MAESVTAPPPRATVKVDEIADGTAAAADRTVGNEGAKDK
jgi:hypothetical protein